MQRDLTVSKDSVTRNKNNKKIIFFMWEKHRRKSNAHASKNCFLRYHRVWWVDNY